MTLTSIIVVVNSEKLYWYPQGIPDLGHLELIGFYAVGVVAFLAVVRRFALAGPAGVILGSAAFSLVVEGAVTPVMYEDGPLPLLTAYFLGWHGVLSVGLVWFGFRRLALDGRRRRLALAAGTYGAVIGLWSTVYWLPSQVDEMSADPVGMWDPGQWTIAKYGGYVTVMTGVLLVSHWAIGHVWPIGWRLGRTGAWVLTTMVALGVGVWTIAIPYAPAKFLGVAWLFVTLIRRTRREPVGTPALSVLETLAGRARFRDVAPLAALAPAAIGVYAIVYVLDPSTVVLDAIYWWTVMATLLGGVGAVVWAVRNRRREATRAGAARPFTP